MAAGKICPALNEEEYWRVFDLIRGDVEASIISNHTYLTINNLTVADREVYWKLNRFSDFWRLTMLSLQTTFFISFGRLFDNRRDSHSIQKLVDITIQNPSLFSKAMLRERKRKSAHMQGPDPSWLVEYVRNAWEPTAAELQPLKATLAPHYDKFKAIYQPIRHKFFAHRSMDSDAASPPCSVGR